ncbi:MAG: hypothetical protein J6S14_17315 [Clostridia bacterium]|nr:hypothetical protein [Clostridia bacterium]
MAYAIVRTDLLTGTDDRAHLAHFKYMKDGELAAIEQGNFVVLKAPYKEDGVILNREVYEAGDMAADTPLHDLLLVASVELNDDDSDIDLGTYINVAGHICRGYYLHSRNFFSVTAEALTGEEPAEGMIVEATAGTKLNVVASATGATKVGTIDAVEVVGKDTYYVIRVA